MNYYFPKRKGVSLNSLKINREGRYSITKPKQAKKIREIVIKILEEKNISREELVITDATANMGGDTISFSNLAKEVNSVEISTHHFEILKHRNI